jgi:hypothetical protein
MSPTLDSHPGERVGSARWKQGICRLARGLGASGPAETLLGDGRCDPEGPHFDRSRRHDLR